MASAPFGQPHSLPRDLSHRVVLRSLFGSPFRGGDCRVAIAPTLLWTSTNVLPDRRPRSAAGILCDDADWTLVVGAGQTKSFPRRRRTAFSIFPRDRNRHCRSHSDDDQQRQSAQSPLPAAPLSLWRSASGPWCLRARIPLRWIRIPGRRAARRRWRRRPARRLKAHSSISGTDSAGRVGAGLGAAGESGRGCCDSGTGARSPSVLPDAASSGRFSARSSGFSTASSS